jgi:hypothetical protein
MLGECRQHALSSAESTAPLRNSLLPPTNLSVFFDKHEFCFCEMWGGVLWLTSRTWLVLVRRTLELKENTTVVVLGASGDLAKKKTVSYAVRTIAT